MINKWHTLCVKSDLHNNEIRKENLFIYLLYILFLWKCVFYQKVRVSKLTCTLSFWKVVFYLRVTYAVQIHLFLLEIAYFIWRSRLKLIYQLTKHTAPKGNAKSQLPTGRVHMTINGDTVCHISLYAVILFHLEPFFCLI